MLSNLAIALKILDSLVTKTLVSNQPKHEKSLNCIVENKTNEILGNVNVTSPNIEKREPLNNNDERKKIEIKYKLKALFRGQPF